MIATSAGLRDDVVRMVTEPVPDPRPIYARLRAEAPVFYSEELDFWYVSTHELGNGILRDDASWRVDPAYAAVSLSGRWPDSFAEGVMSRIILRQDGLDHRRLRRLVSTLFTGRAAARMRSRVEALVGSQLDELDGRDEIELVEDVALRLPTLIILDVCGIDHEHLEQFVAVADSLIAMNEPTATAATIVEADTVFQAAADVVTALASDRRAAPREDLITDLVQAGDEEDRLSDDEMVAMVLFLVVAGHETTANTLCTAVYHLLRNPEALAALRADDTMIASAVEELLRYEPAARNSVRRYPVEDITLGTVTVPKGAALYVGHQAANHDPAVFADPNVLDLGRNPNPHLSLGGGAHYCLGAGLARMELQVGLSALLARFPTIELLDQDVTWRTSFIIRSLEELPLRVRR